ncbi:hypothetical protein [Glycomyces paridis]|uniref:Uncharacterized protein n=1 Tax=Glycomyces paridis TaxID=2126555 RepID=A0A4V4HPH4_9ACTN|nr:hypothetical protein [Glycomyces paridis]THV30046.1 hypothetical protein E9998_06610 [Glycomyces paridis]
MGGGELREAAIAEAVVFRLSVLRSVMQELETVAYQAPAEFRSGSRLKSARMWADELAEQVKRLQRGLEEIESGSYLGEALR